MGLVALKNSVAAVDIEHAMAILGLEGGTKGICAAAREALSRRSQERRD